MKSIQAFSIHPLLNTRLAAYAATGVAVAAPVLAPSAEAAIVYSGPVTISVTQSLAGVYLNLVTGATGTASFAGYDFNPYFSTNLKFYESTTNGNGIVGTSATATALPMGTVISSGSTFLTGVVNGTPNFTGTGIEYAGIQFLNEATGVTNYGWVQLSTTTGTGFPATITGYAYENTGGAIAAGSIVAVPEPTTNAALGLGALAMGAVAVRRLRRRKLAVA